MHGQTTEIHPTAVIEDGAELAAGCAVGPYCVVGAKVRLGENVSLASHVVVSGDTKIGAGTRVWPFASLGSQPQDLKFGGETTKLIVGSNNMIREYVTMNPGTTGGGGVTRVGDNNLFMMQVHVGHDCVVGNNCVFANSAALGGHVVISDNAIIGGLSGIHQFCRIGQGAIVGQGAAVTKDVIPFGSVTTHTANLSGLNLIGLKRRNLDKADVNGLRAAYKQLFSGDGTLSERAQAMAASQPDNPLVLDVLEFLQASSDRSFCLPE